MGGRGRISLAALALAIFTLSQVSVAGDLSPASITVHSRPITEFRIGSHERRFGPLEFVGGLEMTASSRKFGSMSSFRFRSPGGEFIGVADTGLWFFGRVARDTEGRPSGFKDFRVEPIADPDGQITGDKWTTDAEGIAVLGDVASVGFEREHRISEYRIGREGMKGPLRHLDFLVPAYELRRNGGFETVVHAPEDHPLEGALVALAEKSVDKAGNIFAAVLEGPKKGVFTVVRHDDFDITDGAFLPDGDLLLLERYFSPASGVAMRLRRIDGSTIGSGAVVDGPVLLTADMGYQIDNMEGLDVWRRDDGASMISILSDDNQSFFQRNIYVEFRLME